MFGVEHALGDGRRLMRVLVDEVRGDASADEQHDQHEPVDPEPPADGIPLPDGAVPPERAVAGDPRRPVEMRRLSVGSEDLVHSG